MMTRYETCLKEHLRAYNYLNINYQTLALKDILLKHKVNVKFNRPTIFYNAVINLERFEYTAIEFKKTQKELENLFTVYSIDRMRELVDISIRNKAYPEHYNYIKMKIRGLLYSDLCSEARELMAICRREQINRKEDISNDRGIEDVLLEDVSLKEILESVVKRTNSTMEDLKWYNVDDKVIDKIVNLGILRSWALSSLREHSDLLEKEIIIKRSN
tara:strand:+ start:88 stop:735 length:648 start_codon:yes stop_codon:yes gene_type:complete